MTVEEPSKEAALAILRGLKPGLERHHRLRITEEALREAIRLSVLRRCLHRRQAVQELA